MKIQGYDFTLEHRIGTQNQNADAMSRIDYSRLATANIPKTESSHNNIDTGLPSLPQPQKQAYSDTYSHNHIQSSTVETSASEQVQADCLSGREELVQVSFEY